MKKPIIIYGPERSGKSFLARNISMGFENPVFINGRYKFLFQDPFMFSVVTEKTDLIVFEDLLPDNFQGIKKLLHSTNLVREAPFEARKVFPIPTILVEGDLDKFYLENNYNLSAKLIECKYEFYFTFKITSNPDV